MPLPYRWLTSLMMRYNGKSILIDCGEGTQIAMREKGWSPNPIDIICFTHFHADHISGLPGMLLTMGNAERTEPLLLIGPRGLAKVVASLRVIAPELPFEVKCMEITENAQTFSFEGFRLEAFKVNHNVLCYGYSMVIDRVNILNILAFVLYSVPKQLNNLKGGTDMGRFQNTQYVDTVNNITDAMVSFLDNPYYNNIDKHPWTCDYLHINKNFTTLDEGSQQEYAFKGQNSPIRYDLIKNFVLFGPGNRIEVNLNKEEFGVSGDIIEGEFYVLPDTIIRKTCR